MLTRCLRTGPEWKAGICAAISLEADAATGAFTSQLLGQDQLDHSA